MPNIASRLPPVVQNWIKAATPAATSLMSAFKERANSLATYLLQQGKVFIQSPYSPTKWDRRVAIPVAIAAGLTAVAGAAALIYRSALRKNEGNVAKTSEQLRQTQELLGTTTRTSEDAKRILAEKAGSLEKTVSRLTAELAAEKNTLFSTLEENRSQKSKIGVLTDDAIALGNEVKELKTNLRSTLENVTRRIKEGEAQILAHEATVTKLNQELTQAKEQLEALQNATPTVAADRQGEIDALNATIAQLTQEVEALKAAPASPKDDTKLTSDLAFAQSEVRRLSAELLQVQEQIQTAKEGYDTDAKKALTAAEENLGRAQAELTAATEAKAHLEATLDALVKEHSTATAAFELEVSSLKTERNVHLGQIQLNEEAAKKVAEDLTAQLQASKEEAATAMTSHQEALAKAQDELATFKAETAKAADLLKQQLEAAQSENAELKKLQAQTASNGSSSKSNGNGKATGSPGRGKDAIKK